MKIFARVRKYIQDCRAATAPLPEPDGHVFKPLTREQRKNIFQSTWRIYSRGWINLWRDIRGPKTLPVSASNQKSDDEGQNEKQPFNKAGVASKESEKNHSNAWNEEAEQELTRDMRGWIEPRTKLLGQSIGQFIVGFREGREKGFGGEWSKVWSNLMPSQEQHDADQTHKEESNNHKTSNSSTFDSKKTNETHQ
eukprot:TRINITY_DN3376_c0_g2_i1.p1 TRINITY_DN3376_c0_g2~~TRINITY_DN3376_c0_g2_i1.p1  ORF type:complete len:195 (-),score=41.03 TRINITY_DN3376_c0_g2_i1:101-685(-)